MLPGERPTNATGTPTHVSPAFEEEIDLGRYMRPLIRHWRLLVGGALIGTIAGVVVSLKRPTLYEAVSTLLVQQQSASPAAFSTSRALLRNFTLAGETVNQLGLDKAPYHLTPQGFVEGVLTVEEVAGTALIRVKTKLPDPVLAAKACQALADKAVELNRTIAVQGNTDVRNQLKLLLDDASERMKRAEQDLLTQQTQTQVDLLRSDTDAMLSDRESLTRLLVQIEAGKSSLAAAEAELAKQPPLLTAARSVAAEEALRRVEQHDAAERPDSRAEQGRRGDVKQQANRPAAAEQKRTVEADNRPRQERAPSLNDPSEFLDLSGPYVNPVYQTLSFEIARSRVRLAGMERERRQLATERKVGRSRFEELSQLYRGEIEAGRLKNNYALATRVYSDLVVKYEQSRTESVGNMVQLQIVDRAFVPDRPMPRKRVQTAALGLAVGLVLAALIAVTLNLGTRPDARAA